VRKHDLTNRSFYHLLKAYIEVFNKSPSYEEIKTFTGLESNMSVGYHLKRLEEKGIIEYSTKSDIKTNIRIKEKNNE
jgi:SOS-response transcriptional repressor LexA